jgi:DNA-binding CsgD family transcriptional regulator
MVAQLRRQPSTVRPASLSTEFYADGQRRLQVTYIGQVGPGEQLLRLVTEQSGSDEILLREQLALTSREAEILLWLSRGKSNRDIAEILGLSPRTINKHLEQMFEKPGGENRAAAPVLAVRILQN